MKSTVQTGPKSHAGGVRAGFVSVAYQVGTAGAVKIDPISPASRQTTIAAKN
jgi:hypothetical protein